MEGLALIARFGSREWQACGNGGWRPFRYCCLSPRDTSASGWNGRPKLCQCKERAGLGESNALPSPRTMWKSAAALGTKDGSRGNVTSALVQGHVYALWLGRGAVSGGDL